MGNYFGPMPRNREEAERVILEIEHHEVIGVNSGIRSLLGAVLTLGLRTAGCCEGHFEEGDFDQPHHYPWISFWHCGNNFDRLYRILDAYNPRKEIRWIFREETLRPMHEALNESMLRDLQTSANNLADYIFENLLGF